MQEPGIHQSAALLQVHDDSDLASGLATQHILICRSSHNELDASLAQDYHRQITSNTTGLDWDNAEVTFQKA